MRIGLFGGSFDPVHRGHLMLAECCLDQAQLDAVWFVPVAQSPHKPGGPIAAAKDRAAMIELAIAGHPNLELSTIELDRGGISYTIDTLREVQHQAPTAELFLLMGADTLHDLPKWRDPEKILRLATPLVVHRGGEPPADFEVLRAVAPDAVVERARRSIVEMPVVDVSSTGIRQRIGSGSPVSDELPEPVLGYIKEHQLYRNCERPS